MTELANLQVVVGIDSTAAERGLDAFGTKVGGVGSAIQSALGAAAVGAVVGIGAAFVGSVKSAADFEKQMSAVSAVSGASASELESLTKAALQLGKDTSFSASEAATGIEELVKAGVSIADVMGGGARAALDLAAAGAISTGEAAEIAANAMNVFSLKGADMAHVVDIIAGAANASAISVTDYKFSLAAAGAVAATVGIPFESLSTAIALMGQAGIKGSDAGTSLKTMMMNLIPSTAKQNDLFRELGIVTFDVQRGLEGAAKAGIKPATQDLAGLTTAMMDNLGISRDSTKWTKDQRAEYEKLSMALGLTKNNFFDATGSAKDFGEIGQVLQDALKGMTREQQLATLEIMFGSDAIRAAAVLLKAGTAGHEEMAAAMGKVTAQSVATERLNNLWGSVEKLKGSLETGAIILGGMFTPALKRMADTLTDQVNAGIDVLEQIPDVIATISQVLAGDWAPDSSIHPFTNAVGQAVVMLRDTFGPAVSVVSAFITDTLVPGFQAIAGPIAAFIAAFLGAVGVSGLVTAAVGGIVAVLGFLLTPLGAIALAVGLLAAAWTTNFIGIRDIAKKVLGGDLKGAFDLFVTNVMAVSTQIGTALLGWGQAFVAWVAPMIPLMLAALGKLVLDTVSWIVVQAGQLIAALLTWATAFIAWVTPIVPQLLTELGLLLLGVVGWIATVALPAIVTQLMTWATAFWGWVLPAIPPLLAALAGLSLAIGGWIVDTALPAIGTQLLVWGTAFVAWVAAAIPPLLTALGSFQTSLTDWITKTALPVIVTTLAGWVAAFWGWVTTAGPPLLIALAVFLGALTAWIIKTALPGIVTQVGLWATAFWGWVGTATPDLMIALGSFLTSLTGWITKTALPDIVTAVAGWASAFTTWAAGIWPAIQKDIEAVSTSIVAALAELPAKVGAIGKAAIAAFIAGWTSQIPTMPSLPSIPSFGGGGGGTPQSYSGGGSSDPSDFLAQAALARGIDPQQVLAVMGREGPGGWGATGSFNTGTSYGPLQLHYAGGSNPQRGMGDDFTRDTGIDLRTDKSIAAGQRAIEYALDRLSKTGDYREWYGADPALGSRFTPVRRVAPAGGAMPKIPLGGAGPGGDPSQWPGFMSQVDEQLPAYLTSLETIRQSGTLAFNGTLQAGVTAGGAMVSASTAMSTGVGQQYDLMATKVVGSVTGMSDGLQTTLMDSSGNTVATIVGMSGQVTAQYATLANGVSLSMGAMGTTSTATVNAMTGEITTAVTDMAGNVVTTVTTANGTLVGQYVTTGAAVVAAVTTSNEAVVANTTETGSRLLSTTTDALGLTTQKYLETNGAIVTIVTDQNRNVLADFTTSAEAIGTVTDGLGTKLVGSSTDAMGNIVRIYAESNGDMVTIVTDANGQILADYTTTNDAVVATITDMSGQVVETYTSMGADVTGSVEEMASAVVEQYGNIAAEAESSTQPVEDFYTAAAQELDIDFGDAIKEFEKLAKAAKKAADAVEEVSGKGGKKGGDDDDDPFGRDSGKKGDFGESAAYGGDITPLRALAAASGGLPERHVIAIEIGGRIAEEIYVTGRDLAIQRGRA